MPPRPLRHRAAAVLLALLYLLAWGEPVAVRTCPTYGGAGAMAMGHAGHGAASATSHGAMAIDGMAAMAMAPAGDHSAAGHAAGAHAPAGGDHGRPHECRCVSNGCCAAAVGMVARAPQQLRWFAVVTRRADPPAAVPVLPRAVAPRHLPPATGPPALG